MKKPLNLTLLLIGIFLLGSCNKQKLPPEIEIDSNISLGESKVYLNGELEIGYLPSFRYRPLHDFLYFVFRDEPEVLIWNYLRFAGLPLETGSFDVVVYPAIRQNAITTFSQIYDQDLPGYEYKLVQDDDSYFNIELLDTLKQEVKGSFKARFERTSKNGHSDLGLPKDLYFQGVFYEKYESH